MKFVCATVQLFGKIIDVKVFLFLLQLPLFFVKSPRYDLYHKNMKFVNNMVGMTTRLVWKLQINLFNNKFL